MHPTVVPVASLASRNALAGFHGSGSHWLAAGVLAVSLSLAFPTLALAAEFRAGDQIRVEASEVIDGDLYAAGENIAIEGTVNGDIVAAGGTVWVRGPVRGSITLAGGSVTVAGPVQGSARIAGGEVQITGSIAGDVLAAGGEVIVQSSGQVGRDLVAYGGTVRTDGQVQGSVRGAAERLRVNGSVARDINASTGQLELGGQSRVEGNVTYESSNEAAVAPGATIRGQMQRRDPPPEERREPGPMDWVGGFLMRWLMPLAFGALLLVFWPTAASRAAEAVRRDPWTSLAVGALALIVAPVAAFMLMVTIVGLPAGLALLAVYGITLYATQVVIGLLLGQVILTRLGRSTATRGALLLALAVGLFVLAILYSLPVPAVSAAIGTVTVLFGLGAIWRGLVRVPQEPQPST